MTNLNQNYRILFVDDEPRVTSSLKAIFRREYDVLVANSGAEALKILASEHVDVLVSDQRMPQMLGNELLAQVSKLYPQTMRILLTGFMDKQAIVDSINQGEVYRFINKPWRNDEMREVVAEAALASKVPVVTVNAPVVSDSGQSAASDVISHSKPVADQALLMMEQRQDIRHQIRKFCSDQGIMIYSTQNIQQAVAAATSRESIGVAIIELSDQSEHALHTINLLKRTRPELITIALTNEFDAHIAVDLINQGQVFKYLAKPLDNIGFQSAIESAFVHHRFLKNNKQASTRFKVEVSRRKISASLQSFFNKPNSAPN